MKVLIVGAGAVGQVYGHHLVKGGSEVTFLVKEKYVEEARRGYTLFHLNESDPTAPRRFEGFGVTATPEVLRNNAFDVAIVTIASSAMRGAWLDPFLEALGTTPLVLLQPGHEEKALVAEKSPTTPLAQGIIAFIAYQAPLPNETRFGELEGIAYWFPPLSPSPIAGSEPFVDDLVAALKKGGFPAAKKDDVSGTAAFGSCAMNTHIAGLEAAGWEFAEFKKKENRQLSARAAQEGVALISKATGKSKPFGMNFVSPISSCFLLSVVDYVIPIDMETYLKYHFTKVGEQTMLHLTRLVELGDELKMEHSALAELAERVRAQRA